MSTVLNISLPNPYLDHEFVDIGPEAGTHFEKFEEAGGGDKKNFNDLT